jgi:hypothetical protein
MPSWLGLKAEALRLADRTAFRQSGYEARVATERKARRAELGISGSARTHRDRSVSAGGGNVSACPLNPLPMGWRRKRLQAQRTSRSDRRHSPGNQSAATRPPFTRHRLEARSAAKLHRSRLAPQIRQHGLEFSGGPRLAFVIIALPADGCAYPFY